MCIRTEPEDLFVKAKSPFPKLASRFHERTLVVVHLKCVAVASGLQRQGVGTALMGRALDEFYEVTDRTGVAALTLKPLNRDAAAFYASLGFSVFGDHALLPDGMPSMFLPAETVVQAREAAGA